MEAAYSNLYQGIADMKSSRMLLPAKFRSAMVPRQPNGSLGMVLRELDDGGCYVDSFTDSGAELALQGAVHEGDHIIAVNGKGVEGLGQQHLRSLVMEGPDPVVLLLWRNSSKHDNNYAGIDDSVDELGRYPDATPNRASGQGSRSRGRGHGQGRGRGRASHGGHGFDSRFHPAALGFARPVAYGGSYAGSSHRSQLVYRPRCGAYEHRSAPIVAFAPSATSSVCGGSRFESHLGCRRTNYRSDAVDASGQKSAQIGTLQDILERARTDVATLFSSYSCSSFTRWQLQMALHECLPLLAGGEVREMRQGHSQAELSPDEYANGEPCHISSPKERQRMLMMLLASELSAKDIGENILIRDTNVHLKRDSETLRDSQAYWVAMSQSYMRELYEANGQKRVYLYVTPREVAPLPRRFTEAGFERTRCVVNIDVSKHDRARFRSQLSRIEIVYAYPRDIRGHVAPPLVVDFDLYKLKPYLELIGVGTSHSALMPIPSRLSKRDRIPPTETERQTGPLHKFPRCDKDSGSRENVNLRNIIDAHDSAKICDDGDVEDHASASHGHPTIKPTPPPPVLEALPPPIEALPLGPPLHFARP